MHDPAVLDADPVRGPRAEVVVSLKPRTAMTGLARSVAVLAAAPAVDGLVLCPDALVDLGQPLWQGAPFTAFLLSDSGIDDLPLPPPSEPVVFLQAEPITATEAAWVRLKGADALRQAWQQDGAERCAMSKRGLRRAGIKASDCVETLRTETGRRTA